VRPATRTAAAIVVVVLAARPAQALIPDPVETGLLAKIAAAVKAIEELRMRVLARLQEQIHSRVNTFAFPNRLFDPIRTTTAAVLDIRRELQRLVCEWPNPPRTQALREMLLSRTQLCRTGFHDIWGSHEELWDGPLQEANDYVAVMTANMISERVQRTNTSWVRAHKDLFDGHSILRNSPGEANRAEAAALAWANQVAIGNSQIVTQDLLVRQMGRDLDRFERKKAADVTYYVYSGLATLTGGDWESAPPDLGDELPR
jgi:hypothetical protein